ncbi:WD40-repeat-containing domain protein [Blastocladiella britannica]|nr:WD40-repeat-containing domain protein [Blastocladiella britannica]
MATQQQIQKPRLKENFKKERSHGPLYTGGAIVLSPDASTLYAALDDQVSVIDVATASAVRRIAPAADAVTALAITPDGSQLLVATRALQIVVYDAHTGAKLRSWKGHEAPALMMAVDSTGTLVATGSADSTVKVWDIAGAFCTHNFKGHSGLVTAIAWTGLTLVSGGEDGAVRVWDLHARKCAAVLANHVSAVRGIAFLDNGATLVTGGRDKVLVVWDLASRKVRRTVPVWDALEGVAAMPGSSFDQSVVLCAGEKGAVHVVSLDAPVTSTQNGPSRSVQVATKPHAITHLLAAANPECTMLAAVTSDHNIVLLDTANDLARSRLVIGYNDEVIDLAVAGDQGKYLAVATNSAEIKLFDTETHDAEPFPGHEGVVFCLASSRDGAWLTSGSKDKTARVWAVATDDEGRPTLTHHATLMGHAEAVGAVAMSRKPTSSFAVTGSQDRTLKVWDLAAVMSASATAQNAGPVVIRAKLTIKAHDKDINAVAVSPNDRLIATASQDKSCKVWAADTGALVHELKGHRRGVWRCAFSPVDQAIATASGDKSVKLWNLKDGSCLRTFEGHTHSVLNVIFVSFGAQLMTSGSDGLVKLWTVKTNECVATLDAHEDRVWALTTRGGENDDLVVSGGADSVINMWRDCTVEEQEDRLKAEQDMLIQEQDLANYLVKKDYKNAILLALSLNKPYRLLKILEEVSSASASPSTAADAASVTGSAAIDTVLGSLPLPQVAILLGFARDWNTHAKSAAAAHRVFRVVLERHPAEALLSIPEIKTIADAVVAYSERHVVRLDDWATQTYLIDHTLYAMDALLALDEDVDDDEEDEVVEEVADDGMQVDGGDLDNSEEEVEDPKPVRLAKPGKRKRPATSS